MWKDIFLEQTLPVPTHATHTNLSRARSKERKEIVVELAREVLPCHEHNWPEAIATQGSDPFGKCNLAASPRHRHKQKHTYYYGKEFLFLCTCVLQGSAR